MAINPTAWSDYIGQERMKSQLETYMDAAIEDKRMLSHVLLVADPGYGKTTLAKLISRYMGDPFQPYMMPLKRPDMLRALRRGEGYILFFDELHRLSKSGQEDLFTVLDEGYFQDGINRVPTEDLTIIGATTEPQDLVEPIFRRFHIKPSFDPYTDDELALVALNMASSLELDLDPSLAGSIAKAAAGSPSQVEILVRAARDLRETSAIEPVLGLTGITPEGLTREHLEYLRLVERNGPIGIELIGSTLRHGKGYILGLERTLDKLNLIERTSRGRQLTNKGISLTRKGTNNATSTHQRSDSATRTHLSGRESRRGS